MLHFVAFYQNMFPSFFPLNKAQKDIQIYTESKLTELYML